MAEVLTTWFWAYVIGSFLAAGIVFGGIGLLIYAAVQQAAEDKRKSESPMDRWKRKG